MHCSGLQIAPFAASHSHGTKLPCWRAKVELGWDKQRKSPFKTMLAFCLSWPRATFTLQHGGEWLAAKGLIWRENSLQKDLPHFLYIFSKLFFKIIILPQILWSFQCILHSSWRLCFFITIFFCIIKASRIGALIRISWEPLWVDWISKLKCVNLFTLFWVSF